MRKSLLTLSLMILLSGSFLLPYAESTSLKLPPATSESKPPAVESNSKKEQQKGIIDTSYKDVQPLDLLKDAEKWVGEKVSFTGLFVSFSPYALDYPAAMRESKDYIAILIKRPDVDHHTIPLSELKLIYSRKKADEVVELENGDKILVRGKVFSAALGDPWVDLDEVILLKKNPENAAKGNKGSKKHEDLE